MRGKCLDEGMLQSYLDGELSPELTAGAAAHLAVCADCAEALGAAEAENAFFATAFAPDAGLNVPTERLRERLDSSLAGTKTSAAAPRRAGAWGFGRVAAWLSETFNFEPRVAGAFASLLALVILAGLVVYFRRDEPPVDFAAAPPVEQSAPAPAGGMSPAPVVSEKFDRVVNVPVVASNPSKRNVRSVRPKTAANTFVDDDAPAGEARAQRSVPGEENYLRTIASLEKVVEVSGPAALRPQMRSEYERNIAVIDRAIEDTRKAALRNPKDADTAAYLFSAYQNKIELLTTVADQAQVATLGR